MCDIHFPDQFQWQNINKKRSFSVHILSVVQEKTRIQHQQRWWHFETSQGRYSILDSKFPMSQYTCRLFSFWMFVFWLFELSLSLSIYIFNGSFFHFGWRDYFLCLMGQQNHINMKKKKKKNAKLLFNVVVVVCRYVVDSVFIHFRLHWFCTSEPILHQRTTQWMSEYNALFFIVPEENHIDSVAKKCQEIPLAPSSSFSQYRSIWLVCTVMYGKHLSLAATIYVIHHCVRFVLFCFDQRFM